MESDNEFKPFSLLAGLFGEELTAANRPLRMRLAHPAGWPEDVLLPQRISGREALCEGFEFRVQCVSLDACLPLKEFIALPVELRIVTDRGELRSICGIVTEAAAGESDGGLASYQLVLRDALAIMERKINTRVFRKKSELEIVRILFDEWQRNTPVLAAACALEVDQALAMRQHPRREFTMQYNESDAAFLRRLLKRRGINWFFRAGAEGAQPGTQRATPAHTLVLFEDAARLQRNAAGALRFHRDSGTEHRDSITAWSAVRTLRAGGVARHSWDYRNPLGMRFMAVSAASMADQGALGNQTAASLNDYLVETPHVAADSEDQRVLGRLRMARHDYETKCFHGEAGARDLCVGEWIAVDGHPEIDQHPIAEREFVIVSQQIVTWNNLPKDLDARVERLFARSQWDGIGMPAVRSVADAAGFRYRSRFTAVRRGVPIVPDFDPRVDVPQAGTQSAVVVGPAGEVVHCDELGRVKVRFSGTRAEDHAHGGGAGASDTDADSAWVRVATPWAGDGTDFGQLSLPRVGTEVLIAFLGGDPDKPVIVGQLFNRNGQPPALGSADGLPGNRYVSGIQSNEVRGARSNQLRFDDTTGQISAQLASGHARSELNLGWLATQRSDGAGKPRGEGAELRSDAHIALRAAKGMLLSAWSALEDGKQLERGGHLALMEECVELFRTLGKYAAEHQGLAFEDRSQDELRAGFVRWEQGGNTSAGSGGGGAVIGLTAPAGISFATPAAMVSYAGANIDMVSARHLQMAAGRGFNVNAGKGVGLFAQDGGVTAIAHHGKLLLQSQHGDTEINASGELKLTASEGKLTAMADEIVLVSKGGAFIKLADDVTFGAKGNIHFKAADFLYTQPVSMAAQVPTFADPVAVSEAESTLESTFALDQLTRFAKACSQGEFIAMMAPVFGFDIPAPVYVKLYDGLRGDAIANAKIVLVTGGPYPGSFDTRQREIRIHRAAARNAARDKEAAWELLAVLLHEFGHYIDVVLREDLADKHPDGSPALDCDAEGEEGAKFAYALAFFDLERSTETEYARLKSRAYSGSLRVDYNEASQAIRTSQDERAQAGGDPQNGLELFEASGEHAQEHPERSFGHEQIEKALVAVDKLFNKEVRKQIYFGNWLRDFSQILDPKIVRKPDEQKDLTRHMSRKALTKLVAMLAQAKFVDDPVEKEIYRVTQDRLGVYKAVEHIDNPTNNDPKARDPRTIDPDFEPPPRVEYLSVDPKSSMKRYIAASRDFMCGELNMAVVAGNTPNGCRHFGSALHVLEDFFAHSNFVELSLRKAGHTKVLPWTSATQCKHRYPVVTGMFASEDVIASVAGLLANLLFKPDLKFKPRKPGERTMAERVMLVVLEEHSDPLPLLAFTQWLETRDRLAKVPGADILQATIFYMTWPWHLLDFVLNSMLHLLGNSVDDAQIHARGDPNTNGSTDPSHSQLAKDHDTHPFHTLAAELAKIAIAEVARAMAARWRGDRAVDPAAIAAAFIVHPCDSNWQYSTVLNWAHDHVAEMKRGESSTELEALRKEHEQELRRTVRRTLKDSREITEYFRKSAEIISGEPVQGKK